MTTEIDQETKEGIEAIVFLQAVVGLDESLSDALEGWLSMTDAERSVTIDTYTALKEMMSIPRAIEEEERMASVDEVDKV